MPRRLYLAALTSLLLAGLTGSAQACAIDGRPSAFANGVRAVVVKGAPTPATYAWWARFAFPVVFHAGQRVALQEDDAQVRNVLSSLADRRRPWRWRFGDGARSMGDKVSHVYRHAGRFRVAVEAYFARYGWQPFDTITITVRR